jgi:serine/threonine protein kinase
MGEVYRARDTTLNRDVAIKVLPEAFAQDADRLARFMREAQVLASLNHPNIAAIYAIENRALVMELVEGEDLSRPQRLRRVAGRAAVPADRGRSRDRCVRRCHPALGQPVGTALGGSCHHGYDMRNCCMIACDVILFMTLLPFSPLVIAT